MKKVHALFNLEWKNQHAKIFNRLAMRTGMRMGKIRVLYKEDVHEITLKYIEHILKMMVVRTPPKLVKVDLSP